MKPWKDANGDPNLKGRWKAAEEFLAATLNDGALWDAAVKKGKAWETFREKGDIDIPQEVTVICVDPNLIERDKLVVFIMPQKGSTITPIDPLVYWVTAWPPYGGEPDNRQKEKAPSPSKTAES